MTNRLVEIANLRHQSQAQATGSGRWSSRPAADCRQHGQDEENEEDNSCAIKGQGSNAAESQERGDQGDYQEKHGKS